MSHCEKQDPIDYGICVGTEVLFAATPTNGGTPAYQWMKNGSAISGATLSTYQYFPDDGDIIVCEMTSDAACAAPTTVFSQGLKIEIYQPSVSISASPSTVCAGGASTLTATVMGAGTSITYTWYSGSAVIGTTTVNTLELTNLTTSGNYSVSIVNSAGCTAASSSIPVTVTPAVTPTINILAIPD